MVQPSDKMLFFKGFQDFFYLFNIVKIHIDSFLSMCIKDKELLLMYIHTNSSKKNPN